MSFNFPEGEFLLINKPYMWTSFDVVAKLRVILKYKLGIKKIKVGHAGTLDPLATGLLILCTGKFTKKIDDYQALVKEYTGIIKIGATTPSFDLETEICDFKDYSKITSEKIIETSKLFIGETLQFPPQYSAIQIEGKRAYEYARGGKTVEIKAKPINILEFEIISIRIPEIEFRIVCSKGTYIRSIANDFGQKLGCGAYLSSLCRTKIGEYKLSDAISLDEFEKMVLTNVNY
jgi:tRNA pseudouridine55 synthase